MAIRINPNLARTEELVTEILRVALSADNPRVAFLCPAGESEAILGRIRVYISRSRKQLQQKGKRVKQFKLRSTVHPETHGGKRHDCVVLWRQTSEVNQMTEMLEDILSNG